MILRPNLILRIYWIYYWSNIRHFQAAETRFSESNLNLSILWNVQLPSCNKVNLDAILSLENLNSNTSNSPRIKHQNWRLWKVYFAENRKWRDWKDLGLGGLCGLSRWETFPIERDENLIKSPQVTFSTFLLIPKIPNDFREG